MTDEELFEIEKEKFKPKNSIKALIALSKSVSYEEMAKETLRTARIEYKRLMDISKKYRHEYDDFMKEG